ncbi:type II toxin-antitoxin system VapB family antitoxin [Dactylosporangium sp. CA-233914]|uniref:type II toxin-antitoxin system VapB family antitoxin n=1 Tax=Dactylosporangium sp. CA-233914 TaxID=3239934 RepID=UPI003D915278
MTETVAHMATEPQIDQELLEEAQRHLGGVTPNEALNEGLYRLVEQERGKRREALEKLRRMSDEGLFDYPAIEQVDE